MPDQALEELKGKADEEGQIALLAAEQEAERLRNEFLGESGNPILPDKEDATEEEEETDEEQKNDQEEESDEPDEEEEEKPDKKETGGYQPKDDWEEEALKMRPPWKPNGKLSAKEFILRANDIALERGRELKELLKSNEKMREMLEKQERERETGTLRQQLQEKNDQLEELIDEGGDPKEIRKLAVEVNRIEEQIENGSAEKKEEPSPKDNLIPEFRDWLEENDWYDPDSRNYDPELAAVAAKTAKENDGKPITEIIEAVDKRVENYKKFINGDVEAQEEMETKKPKKKPKSSDVMGGRRISNNGKGKMTAKDLNEVELREANRLIKDKHSSVKTLEDYIKRLEKI